MGMENEWVFELKTAFWIIMLRKNSFWSTQTFSAAVCACIVLRMIVIVLVAAINSLTLSDTKGVIHT